MVGKYQQAHVLPPAGTMFKQDSAEFACLVLCGIWHGRHSGNILHCAALGKLPHQQECITNVLVRGTTMQSHLYDSSQLITNHSG